MTAALESLAAGQPMACPGLRLQTVPAPRPGQVAAAILAIMDRPGLFEPSRWIDVPSGTADAPGLRREAARADCGIVAGLPGWAAILTVHDQAQLDETDGRRHGRSRFLCRCDDDPGRLHPVELDDLARRALALPAAEARQLSSPYIAVPEIRDALHGIINRDQEETRS